MELKVHQLDGDVGHIQLRGRLDPHGTKTVDAQFREETIQRDRSVVVDLSTVTFITSVGIGLLIDCATSLKRKGFHFILVEPSGHVHQVLRKTGVYRIIPSASSIEDALGLAKNPPTA